MLVLGGIPAKIHQPKISFRYQPTYQDSSHSMPSFCCITRPQCSSDAYLQQRLMVPQHPWPSWWPPLGNDTAWRKRHLARFLGGGKRWTRWCCGFFCTQFLGEMGEKNELCRLTPPKTMESNDERATNGKVPLKRHKSPATHLHHQNVEILNCLSISSDTKITCNYFTSLFLGEVPNTTHEVAIFEAPWTSSTFTTRPATSIVPSVVVGWVVAPARVAANKSDEAQSCWKAVAYGASRWTPPSPPIGKFLDQGITRFITSAKVWSLRIFLVFEDHIIFQQVFLFSN